MSRPKNPLKWDTPHREKPTKSLLSIRLWYWLIIDIGYITRNLIWNKMKSLKASRQNVYMDLSDTMRELRYIAEDEEVPEYKREAAQRAQEQIKQTCEELNIHGRHIEENIIEEN